MKQTIKLITATWLLYNIQVCLGERTIEIETAEMTSRNSVLTKIPQALKWSSSPRRRYTVIDGEEYAWVTKFSGILKVKNEMDREKLCIDNRPHCTVQVQVATLPVDGRGEIEMVNIEIEVTDINDNAPAFENKLIDKSLSEAVRVGTTIRLDSAVDPDYGSNSIQDYRLASEGGSNAIDEYFELKILKSGGTKIPELKLKRRLDRERKGVHELILEATDGGTPAKTGTAIVRINITDSNDNVPKFEKSAFNVNVDEHAEQGKEIIRVQATDEDTGENGRIIYKFPSIVGERDRKIFALDQNTGAITIKNSTMLDYETKKIHQLTVEAKDNGPNAVSAYASIFIHIQDVNDNKPEFAVKYMNSRFIINPPRDANYDQIVMEDTKIGQYVAFVTVTDEDAGTNGSVTCELEGTDAFILEGVNDANTRFALKTNDKLDREKKDIYELNIVARDKGNPPQSGSTTIRLKVGDINDNPPEFSYETFKVKVSETLKKGDLVMKLKATDRDEYPGPNSNITYSFIQRNNHNHIRKDGRSFLLTDIFEVNPATGDVLLAIPDVLDAETERAPGFLTVLANDNGVPRMNATAKLEITVSDENDNAPKFKNQTYVFHVKEHVAEGKYIGQVEATDDDYSKDTNGKVTYSMEQFQSSDRSIRREDHAAWLKMFQVASMKGYINFYGNNSKLDREVYGDKPIVLTVVATDHGYNPHRTKAVVKIYLEDINDNAPLIQHPDGRKDIALVHVISKGSQPTPENAKSNSQPSRWASVVSVSERSNATGSGVGSVSLSQIRATDPDLGENAMISFAIVDGNTNGYFDVDAKTGNVTLMDNVDVDSLKLGCHILKVEVSDFGNPQLHSYAYVNLYLSKPGSSAANFTKAMLECKANPLFPKPKIDVEPHQSSMTFYLIVGFASLIVIILLIIAIVLIKCCCCSKRKKSRSYNCQEGTAWNASSGYDVDSKKNIRKRGSGKRLYNGHGTVDSRSSFHSEWTASQSQLPPDKMEKARIPGLPDVQSVGSAESPIAHDSGTGDSVSGEAYHHPNYNDMVDGHNYIPTQDGQYMRSPRAMSPMKYSGQVVDLAPQHMLAYADPNVYNRGMISPKCTNECLLYGHGDHCWMPDSLLRNQGQGPIDMMAGGNPDRVVYQNHPDSHGLRYHGDPSTPYYYDPGKKFSHLSSTEGSDQLSYSKGLDEAYRHPMDALSHQGYPVPAMHAPSPHPLQQRMYQDEADRERAYINLNMQGYDTPMNQREEMHSNLSSTSSNNNPYGAGLPQNHPRVENHPQMFYQVPNMPNSRYETRYHPGMHDTGTIPAVYNEDYSASNLLPAMSSVPPDYNQHWDHNMPVAMEQQPLINRTEYIPSRSGRTSNPVLDERAKLIPTHPDGGKMNPEDELGMHQLHPGDEKLTTIQEGGHARSGSVPL